MPPTIKGVETDEYGYQYFEIKADLVNLKFPDGNVYRGSWEMLASLIDAPFRQSASSLASADEK